MYNRENGEERKESLAEKTQRTAQNVRDKVKKAKDISKKAKNIKNMKAAAQGSKFLTALGPALPYIGIALLVILIIIFLIGIIVFVLTMPGMVMEKLKAMFQALGNSVAAFFGGDTTYQIQKEEIYEILDYLEDMGYDLKGYGFLTEYWDEDDIATAEEEDSSDQEGEVDNGVIRGKDTGRIIGASSEFILTYIMSDNYVYTIKNFNVINNPANDEGFWSNLWGGIVAVGQKIAGIFVDEGSLWGKGMIYLEDQYGNEWQNGLHVDWSDWPPKWETIGVDPETKTLSVTRGLFANAFEFSLDGWTGRYGMPLEFLLSVHLATNMPDLAYDMVHFFGTEVTIRMAAANAKVESAVKNDKGELVTYEELYDVKSSGWSPFDGWTLSKEEAKTILEEYDFESQKEGKYGCTGVNDATVVDWPSEVAGKCYTDASNDITRGELVTDQDDLINDLADNKYTNWSKLYDYIYANGEQKDSNTYTFSLPTNGADGTPAFSLSGIKAMLKDLRNAWDRCNEKVQANQKQENQFIIPAGKYEYYVMKKLDEYPSMSLNTLSNKDNNDTIYIDMGCWYVNEGEEQVDYQLELQLIPSGDNWEYAVIIYRDMKQSEIEAKGYTVEDSNLCSNNNKEKCCSNCRKYIKAIMNSASEVSEEDMATYTPYIRKVTDHWYRDVYFEAEGTMYNVNLDEEYELLMKERWTLYETYTDDESAGYKYNVERAGQTILYELDDKGNYKKDGSGNYVIYDGTADEAKEEGISVSKKAVTSKVANNWSAYDFSDDYEDVTDWTQAYPDDDNEINQKIYIKTTIYGGVKQEEEGIRVETNEKIKRIFANNYYFKYDGNQESAEVIYQLRNKHNFGYGNLNGDEGKGGSATTLKNNLNKSITAKIGDSNIEDTYMVKEYASKVDLTKDALAAFSMLENTHTEDADYIYRDFKELIVELGYFEKEELAESIPEVFQWFIPEIGSGGYPIRSADKKENMYGTMAHSKDDYDALDQLTIAATQEAFAKEEAKVGSGSFDVTDKPDTNQTKSITLDDVSNVNTYVVKGVNSGSVERISESGDGYHYKVKVNNVTYTHYYQFDGSYKDNPFIVDASNPPNTIQTEGCGPTSCCNILTGYGIDITPADTAGFLKTLGSNSNLVKVMENWDVGAEWIDGKSETEYIKLMEQAVSEGKPFVVLMNNGNGNFWTKGGHFVAVAGVDSSGNLITLDTGSSSSERHTYTGGIEGAAKTVEGILIPDEAPNGMNNASNYEGYQGGEAVVAPATGILLEYGTYPETTEDDEDRERINYDLKYPFSGLTGAGLATTDTAKDATGVDETTLSREVVEQVGYAKILVLDSDYFVKLEEYMGKAFGDSLKTKTGFIEKTSLTIEDLKSWTEEQITLYGYKEFVQRYESFDLGGYIIYLDGFECELPNPNYNPEEGTGDPGSGTMLSMDYFKQNAESYEESLYESDIIYQLSSDEITARLKAEEQVKSTAKPLIYDSNNDILFIKEGTVIGRTRTDKEVVEARGESYDDYRKADVTVGSTEEVTKKIIGNYIRIVMRDRDDTVVENIEEYLKLDEEQAKELEMEKFLYWMGVYIESGHLDDSGENSVSFVIGDGDDNITHFFGLTQHIADLYAELGYGEFSTAAGQKLPLESLANTFIALIERQKAQIKNELGEDIDNGYLQAFISVLHNYGNLTERGEEYKSKKSVSETTWTTYNGNHAEALRKRRKAEWILIEEGRYVDFKGSDPEADYPFESETPFTDWCKEHGITNLSIK